jgi:hypothetical protein
VPATSESLASFPHECWVGTKPERCERVEPSPLTLALSPNPRNVLGEREDIVGTLTHGGARGDGGPAARASRLCPGLQFAAPLGLYVAEAASCRFTNIQSPEFSRKRESRISGFPEHRQQLDWMPDYAGMTHGNRLLTTIRIRRAIANISTKLRTSQRSWSEGSHLNPFRRLQYRIADDCRI